MFDHVSLKVKDSMKSTKFFARALEPLGYRCTQEYDGGAGFGRGDSTSFWIGQGDPHSPGVHVAFAAPDRSSVDAFHAAALRAGGRDNGAPGIRESYGPTYYAAFVLDPDGNNIEAVCLKASGK